MVTYVILWDAQIHVPFPEVSVVASHYSNIMKKF